MTFGKICSDNTFNKIREYHVSSMHRLCHAYCKCWIHADYLLIVTHEASIWSYRYRMCFTSSLRSTYHCWIPIIPRKQFFLVRSLFAQVSKFVTTYASIYRLFHLGVSISPAASTSYDFPRKSYRNSFSLSTRISPVISIVFRETKIMKYKFRECPAGRSCDTLFLTSVCLSLSLQIWQKTAWAASSANLFASMVVPTTLAHTLPTAKWASSDHGSWHMHPPISFISMYTIPRLPGVISLENRTPRSPQWTLLIYHQTQMDIVVT